YLRKARQLHPDLAPGRDGDMAELNHAWEVLGDPVRRRAYDAGLVARIPVEPTRRRRPRRRWPRFFALVAVSSAVGGTVLVATQDRGGDGPSAPPGSVSKPAVVA